MLEVVSFGFLVAINQHMAMGCNAAKISGIPAIVRKISARFGTKNTAFTVVSAWTERIYRIMSVGEHKKFH